MSRGQRDIRLSAKVPLLGVFSVLWLAGSVGLSWARGSASPGRPIRVEVRREGDQFQLYRDGEPCYVKGAVYWANPHGRFPLADLAARGANSIRSGSARMQQILDEAHKLKMTVTVGLRMKMEAVHNFDYDDEEAVKQQFEQMRETVLKYKDHPALLMWGVGNELSRGYTNRRVWDAVDDVAEMIHALDPYHPTMTVIGGASLRRGDIKEIKKRCPAIDILGINHYQGIETVPHKVREDGWEKPYCITEWGPSGHWQVRKTRWGIPIEETSTEKAARYKQRYENTIIKDAERCLGSYAFFWGAKQERTHTWYGMFLASGERTEAVEVMQYLWTSTRPANRAPKILTLQIDDQSAFDNINLISCTAHIAKVQVSDPDNDSLTFKWEILPEPTKFGYGGGGERKPGAVPNLIKATSGEQISFVAPEREGNFRLFVTVLDGKGNAAVANIPFHVSR